MATKNLYTLDTVAAMMCYAMTSCNIVAAVHAAREIASSGENELLWKLLALRWFLLDPCADRDKSIYDVYLTGDCAALLSKLLLCPSTAIPDLPVERVLLPPKYGVRCPPVHWNKWPKEWTAEQAGSLWYAVNDALKHRNWLRAYELTAPLLKTDVQSIVALLCATGIAQQFADLLETTVFVPVLHRILMHAFAVLIVDPRSTILKTKVTAKKLVLTPANSRPFAISPDALAIWNVRSKPMSQLIGAPLYVADEPTAFWSELITKYGAVKGDEEFIFSSDNNMEAFYTEGFPNDVPDEWSIAERAKSHGIVIPDIKAKNPWTTAFILCFP